MNKNEMLKEAASVLRTQKAEIEELREKIARQDRAEAIVKDLVENDALGASEVLEKVGALRDKTLEELQIIEKAAELYAGNFTRFGKLADEIDESSGDSLTTYLLSDEER